MGKWSERFMNTRSDALFLRAGSLRNGRRFFVEKTACARIFARDCGMRIRYRVGGSRQPFQATP